MASKKKVHHEEHADETWLLPYADLLTLLLALFIVMFAISTIDKNKFEKFSMEMNSIFAGGRGVLQNDGNSAIPLYPTGATINTPAKSNPQTEEDKMKGIKSDIEKEFEQKGYTGQGKVVLNDEGIQISIQDALLFSSGDAEVLHGISPFLLQISKILKDSDNNIKVVGHTDNIPIQTAKYRSNWDLSVMRAINVMNFLVEQGGLNPERFSVQGFGQYSPKYNNSTEAGRAKNRRVEIFLIRKYPAANDAKDIKKN